MPPHPSAMTRMPTDTGRARVLVLLAVVALGLASGGSPLRSQEAASGGAGRDDLLGVWSGRSLCTNRELSPACKDEEVVYTFGPLPGAESPSVHLVAEKIEAGERLPMGEFDLRLDASTGEWTAEFRSPRFHGLWSFRVVDGGLAGTLVELPSRAQLREVAASRAPATSLPAGE